MKSKAFLSLGTAARSVILILVLVLVSVASLACSRGQPELPAPRPIVIRSGARLFAEPERLEATDAWFRPQQNNISTDPSFWIITVERETPSFPWESLVLVADTAKIGVQRGFTDAAQVFEIYAHYHLMKEMGRIGEFLPGGETLEGFSFERAILARVADAWLLGRAVYQAEAFDPLEELVYANENGYLDAMLLTARGDEFKEERRAWLKEDPEALERYRQWFVDTFSREPPGLREIG
ncbi:MAG: hypothetical protein ABIF09_07550 [Gemmatimonadota bacterium]